MLRRDFVNSTHMVESDMKPNLQKQFLHDFLLPLYCFLC